MILSLVILQLAAMLYRLNIAASIPFVMANIAHLLIPANGTAIPQVVTLVHDAEATTNVVAGAAFFIGLGGGVTLRALSFGNERRIALSNAALGAAVAGLLIFLARFAIQSYFTQLFPGQ